MRPESLRLRPLEGERQFETALRPTRLADFTGQPKLKENLGDRD